MTGKLVPAGEVRKLGEQLRRDGKRFVSTNGCFDLLHAGHIRYLQRARALGDALFVAVNSDASVRRLKGPGRPIVPEAERAELLAALECVDYVTVFDDALPIRVLTDLRPDLHVKGGDYIVETLPETPAVRAGGGDVVVLPFVAGYSTTELISRCAELERSGKRE